LAHIIFTAFLVVASWLGAYQLGWHTGFSPPALTVKKLPKSDCQIKPPTVQR
jgi:hypothetical protein